MRNIQWTTDLPFSLPPIVDITDTLAKHKTKRYGKREKTTAIIVHHTVTTAPISNMATSTVNNKDYPGLGYHLVIERDRLYQVNDLDTESYHAKGWNDESVGIAIVGDLTKRPMTDTERMLLYGAILTVKGLYGTITDVYGHNEAAELAKVGGTECPATDCNRIRNDIVGLEAQIAYRKSEKGIRSQAYAVANNVAFLYNMANGKDEHGKPANPQQQEWAVRKLIELFPAFVKAGLLKQ